MKFPLSRRQFLATSLGGMLVACGKGNTPTTANPNPGTGINPIEEETPQAVNRSFTYIGPNNLVLGDDMQGSHNFSDGTNINVWSFGQGNGFNADRILPSPVIELVQGQNASITLQSNMPHSIHFHGLDVDQANDGVPLTSGYVAATLNRDFGQVGTSVRLGPQFTYSFVPNHAGTYIYHCHVDTVLHVEMGMIGTVIVRPPEGDINRAWQGGPFFDKEYIWQLHTVDTRWHQQLVSGAFCVDYNPNFFMVNGRDNVDNDPATAISGSAGERILIRAVNIGFLPALIDLGNQNFQVIASDGRPLRNFQIRQQILVGPGERYDLIYNLNSNPNPANVAYYAISDLNNAIGQVQIPINLLP